MSDDDIGAFSTLIDHAQMDGLIEKDEAQRLRSAVIAGEWGIAREASKRLMEARNNAETAGAA